MTDAQVGLAIATPIIIGFAIVLYGMGVLQRTGVLLAVLSSLVIAAVLFLTQ
ncbi:hypothetical protein [Gellertiella hungarica]|uniref:Uncharacterized protein n=1 Tax=Gellertiella hungarica TaxID=1572859 RepID=A0A7W6NL06_9HYPH|nr:hypothetical protein [Gellertiella hungarica]MBB4065393.1 hypothetical protein [Gellertiella hungarica]